MGRWISKLAKALAGDDPTEEARGALRAAHEARVKLKLEPLRTSIANATVMTAAIEVVREDDMIISQPVIGGVARRLMKGEAMRLSFSLKDVGHVMGETEVLGRHKIPSGGGKSLHGYRLAMPDELFPDNRRTDSRSTTTINLAREVELYRRGGNEPIRGVVQNLSLGGMQIRTHDSEPNLKVGDRFRLVVHLPPPVGGINRMVTVARMAGNRNPRHRVIGIAFEREIDGMRALLSKGGE